MNEADRKGRRDGLPEVAGQREQSGISALRSNLREKLEGDDFRNGSDTEQA
ncbi:MAG: hypothetical protein R3D26_12065 [Cyanobacteriota/Melainabacteria group bacterium]